jgi:hypothetical protein
MVAGILTVEEIMQTMVDGAESALKNAPGIVSE